MQVANALLKVQQHMPLIHLKLVPYPTTILKAKADPEVRTVWGQTAMHHARTPQIVAALMRANGALLQPNPNPNSITLTQTITLSLTLTLTSKLSVQVMSIVKTRTGGGHSTMQEPVLL